MRAAVALRVDEANPLVGARAQGRLAHPGAGSGPGAHPARRDHGEHARPLGAARRRRAARVVPARSSAATSWGGTTTGNEVMVTGAFGDPDAGGGDETFDPNRSLISEDLPGSFGEYTVVPARNVIPQAEVAELPPSRLRQRELVDARTGSLFTRGRAQPGERVLIQGAGGGVATAAIAMARAAGLHVIVTSRSEAKRQRALEIGAHEAIPSGERVREPVDIVRRHGGRGDVEAQSALACGPVVAIVTAGATTGIGRAPRAGARLLPADLDHRIDLRLARRHPADAPVHGGRSAAPRHRLRLSVRAHPRRIRARAASRSLRQRRRRHPAATHERARCSPSPIRIEHARRAPRRSGRRRRRRDAPRLRRAPRPLPPPRGRAGGCGAASRRPRRAPRRQRAPSARGVPARSPRTG